jgi:hypothetical protein
VGPECGGRATDVPQAARQMAESPANQIFGLIGRIPPRGTPTGSYRLPRVPSFRPLGPEHRVAHGFVQVPTTEPGSGTNLTDATVTELGS